MTISNNRISISGEKVEALRIYPVPRNFPDVRRFLGFANYVQQFIPHFSTKASALANMLKGQEDKKKKFIWIQDQASICVWLVERGIDKFDGSSNTGSRWPVCYWMWCERRKSTRSRPSISIRKQPFSTNLVCKQKVQPSRDWGTIVQEIERR